MTAMKELLTDLAEQAPQYDVTGAALVAGRRRHRRTVAGGVAAVAVAVLLVGAGWWLPTHHTPAHRQAPPAGSTQRSPIDTDLIVGRTLYRPHGPAVTLPTRDRALSGYQLAGDRWLVETLHGSATGNNDGGSDLWVIDAAGHGTRLASKADMVVVDSEHTLVAWSAHGVVTVAHLDDGGATRPRTARTGMLPVSFLTDGTLVLINDKPAQGDLWSPDRPYRPSPVDLPPYTISTGSMLAADRVVARADFGARSCVFTLDPRHSFAAGPKSCVSRRVATADGLVAQLTETGEVLVPGASDLATILYRIEGGPPRSQGRWPFPVDHAIATEANIVVVVSHGRLGVLYPEHAGAVTWLPLPRGARGTPVPVTPRSLA